MPFDPKACLLGPALAPLVGGKYNLFPQKGAISKRSLFWLGAVAYYYSWRAMQGFLGVVGFLIFCMMYCWFPETSQPGCRGIDKMRAESGENTKSHFYFINPLRPMLLLRSPNLLLIVSKRWDWFDSVKPYSSVGHPLYLFTDIFRYVLPPFLFRMCVYDKVKTSPCRSNCLYHRMSESLPLFPLSKLNAWKGTRYHITNGAFVGACFLPSGLGTICKIFILFNVSRSNCLFLVGAQIVGRISDYTVIRWRKKRGGIWYPEDRLRASLIPFAVIVPIPLIAFGIINQYVDGRLGLIGCLICLFFNGLGVSRIMQIAIPINAR